MLVMAQKLGRRPTKAEQWLNESSIFDDLDELRTFKPDRPLVESIGANAFHSKPPALYVEEDVDSDFGSVHGSDDEAAQAPDLNGITSLIRQVGGNYGVEDIPAVHDEGKEAETKETVSLKIIHDVIDEAIELSKRSILDPTVAEFVPKYGDTPRTSLKEVPVDKLIDISSDIDESVGPTEQSSGKCTNKVCTVLVDYSKGDSVDIPEREVVNESTPAGDSLADKKVELKKKIIGRKHSTGRRSNAAISSLLLAKGDFDSCNIFDISNQNVAGIPAALQQSNQENISEPVLLQQSTIKLLTPDAFLLPVDTKQNEEKEIEVVVTPKLLDIIPEDQIERPILTAVINDSKAVENAVLDIQKFKIPTQHSAGSKPKDLNEIEFLEIKKSCQKVEDWLKKSVPVDSSAAIVDLPKAKAELKPVLNLKQFTFKAPDPSDCAAGSYQNKNSDASSFRLASNATKNDTSSASTTPGPSTRPYEDKVQEIYNQLKKSKDETQKEVCIIGFHNLYDKLKEYENGKVSPNAKKKKDKKTRKNWRTLLREQNGEPEEAGSGSSNANEEN